jgi:hypothetical protein
MDNEIIYSDEQESNIVSLYDVIPPIEEHIELPVIDIRPVRSREDVHSSPHAEDFPDQKPLALWWFLVTFDSPEGKRAAMVQIALEEHGLRVIRFDPPELLFFNALLRKRAKEEAAELTQEYIAQLEAILRRAQTLWKTANEHAKDIPGLRDDVYLFHVAFRKVGYLSADTKDGGPQGLGLRRLYLPSWLARSPDEYVTGNDEVL